MNEEIEWAVEQIEEASYEWKPYSGRGMYGKSCISIVFDELTELFELGQNLPEFDKPKIDNMGRGYVAYWPKLKLDEQNAA